MSVAKSSLFFACGTLLSRATGLLRDMSVASSFGASAVLDAFIVAFRIPNLFRDMLSEGALGNSFTKVYTSVFEKDGDEARVLLSRIFFLSAVASILFCSIAIYFAPELVKVFTLMGSGTGEKKDFLQNAVVLTRVLFPFLGLATLSAILMGVLHQSGHFFFSSLIPITLNLGFIFGVFIFPRLIPVTLSQSFPVDHNAFSLSVGVLTGGAAGTLRQSGVW